MTHHPNTPASRNEAASVVEQIAQQWDGCMHDSVGGDIDIGQAIRDAGKDLAASRTEQAAPSVASGVESGAVYWHNPENGQVWSDVDVRFHCKNTMGWTRVVIPAAPGAAIAANAQDAVQWLPWQAINEDDLSEHERFLVDGGIKNAAFFPIDADRLANVALHCIREVRATRAAIAAREPHDDALMKLSQFAHTAAHMSESDMRNNLSSIADQLIVLASRQEAPAASAQPACTCCGCGGCKSCLGKRNRCAKHPPQPAAPEPDDTPLETGEADAR